MTLDLPRIIYGSSALGNLYGVVPDDTKRDIVKNWLQHQPNAVIDSAGKYGAGLSLESIGRFLKELNIGPNEVRISNKLGWKRVPLEQEEPTFEPGAWFGLEHDAAQSISYDGILECYEQGNSLLYPYTAQLVSVHDPDEYLASGKDSTEKAQRYQDILDAYRALVELREQGKVLGVGVGSKDWRTIKQLYEDGVSFDWVMLANSYTIYDHAQETLDFILTLNEAGITIINSAVFNAGFLIGGKYFNYEVISRESHPEIFEWRERFISICEKHQVSPAHACCQFAIAPPGVQALALNTSRAERVADNVAMVTEPISEKFWSQLKAESLLPEDYPYL